MDVIFGPQFTFTPFIAWALIVYVVSDVKEDNDVLKDAVVTLKFAVEYIPPYLIVFEYAW